jgi:hypothetical protein
MLGFSVDLIDDEGDVWDECILLHIGDCAIIKFHSYSEVVAFATQLNGLLPELKENLPLERQLVVSSQTDVQQPNVDNSEEPV